MSETREDFWKNTDLREFLSKMPLIDENLRECGLAAVDWLSEREIYVTRIQYSCGQGFSLHLMALSRNGGVNYGHDELRLDFGVFAPLSEEGDKWYQREWNLRYDLIACQGSDIQKATKENVISYLEWLDKHLPRRYEDVNTILQKGNPDNLEIPWNCLPPSNISDFSKELLKRD